MNAGKLTHCLIANRGEIAVRVLRACRELGIKTTAVYSDVDADALHVRLADHAVSIGLAPAQDSYLRIEALIAAAHQTGCDCVHPGYGFLSESDAFAQAVISAGLTWVGPPPSAIRAMGVKTEARALMARAGVPLVPGFQRDDADEAAFTAAAAQIGYPVMVKAAGGGGGKGIRIVRSAADLPDALASARREAEAAFGDGRLFLERYIEHGRHIEIQIMADQYGAAIHLGERECSLQRRHQKILEEAPSPLVDADLRARMGAAAVAAAQAVGYVNAGTVEFIVTPEREFYFLEMNTRLQVEHPITEAVYGLDLVRLQFMLASGAPLTIQQAEVQPRGHAIECRLYAEDAARGFLPAVGDVLRFSPPHLPGLRVDSGVQSGDTISIYYDPLIAKLIVHAATRAEAIDRMLAALRQTVILGLTTNASFLCALLAHPALRAGEIDTGFIERHLDALLPPPDSTALALGLIAAALSQQHAAYPMQSDVASADPWSASDGFRLGS